MSDSTISEDDWKVIRTGLRVVTSENDMPPAGEFVVFLVPVKVSKPDGSICEVLETFFGYVNDEDYYLGSPILDHEYGDDTGWTVDIGTIWIPITKD